MAVINADDPFAAYWTGLNQDRPVLRFGLEADTGAEVAGRYILKGLGATVAVQNSGRRIDFELQAPGVQQRSQCAGGGCRNACRRGQR